MKNYPNGTKNTVAGDISDVENVKIGDEVHYHPPPKIPKELTARIPKTPPDKIVGRENDLDDLHQRLMNYKQVLLVNGLGGIGKTTLAQVYVAKYWEEYQHIAWISQSSKDVLYDLVNTEGLLEHLKISTHGKEVKMLFRNIMTELKSLEKRPNLLVIDNANTSLSQLYDYLPAPPQWHILVTSRRQLPRFEIKVLDFLSTEEAIELFLRYYTYGKITQEAIRELVTLVDFHTLTIEILAKTAQTQRTKIDVLKQALEKDLRANVYVNHKGDKIEKVTAYLGSIFTISALTDNEIWLLKQFACLPAEFHRYEQLEELINPATSQREEIFAETLAELSAAGWLLPNKDSYKMHRIIAAVVKPITTLAEVEPLLEQITEKLSLDQTKDNPVDKFPWIPHGKSMLAIFPDSDNAKISELQNNLALVLRDLGDYAEAKTLLEQALRCDEKNFGSEHPSTAVIYSNLASVLRDLGDYAGAKTLFEQALRCDEKNFGSEHPSTAVTYSNLALVLRDLGDYAGAKTLLEQALRCDEKNFGSEHPSTAVRYSNLALVLRDLGDYERALELSAKSLHVLQQTLPPEHPHIKIVSENHQSIKTEITMESIHTFLEKTLGYILKAAAQSQAAATAKEELLNSFWQWLRPFIIKDLPETETQPNAPETETKTHEKLLELIQDEAFFKELVTRVDALQTAGIKEKNIVKKNIERVKHIKIGDKIYEDYFDRKNIVEGNVKDAEDFTLGDGH